MYNPATHRLFSFSDFENKLPAPTAPSKFIRIVGGVSGRIDTQSLHPSLSVINTTPGRYPGNVFFRPLRSTAIILSREWIFPQRSPHASILFKAGLCTNSPRPKIQLFFLLGFQTSGVEKAAPSGFSSVLVPLSAQPARSSMGFQK